MLDLHPAIDVIATEVQLNDVQVRDDHRRFRGSLLVVVEPLAAQSFRLVPHLQQILVVLHDHLELLGGTSVSVSSDNQLTLAHRILVELSIQVGLRATPGIGYAEGVEGLLAGRLDVDTALVTVLSF